jgi:putative hydrolase of the HAD superfamily
MNSPSTNSPKENSRAYDYVLFDLGGVLVKLTGVAVMQRLAGIDHEEEVWERWLACEWVRRFERGLCSVDDFGRGVVSDWELPIGVAEFVEAFGAWPESMIDGAEALVRDAGEATRVGCLSNTNALHWEERMSRWSLGSLFDVTFLSYQMGLVKPDREVFEYVAAALDTPATRVVLVDDNAINVEQAAAVGFAARQARGVEEARAALVDLGVLS